MYAHVGAQLVVEGDATRKGLIIDVPHDDGSPPYIVKWLANGHIAMVFPGEFARLIRAAEADSSGEPLSPVASQALRGQRRDVVRHERL